MLFFHLRDLLPFRFFGVLVTAFLSHWFCRMSSFCIGIDCLEAFATYLPGTFRHFGFVLSLLC